MIFLISLAFALVFLFTGANALKKHAGFFYAAAALIAAVVVYGTLAGVQFPHWFQTWIWPVFARGALAGSLFVIVMVTGAFPNGSKPIKKLMPIRGQLSILACILTLGHNIAYGKTYFTMLFFMPSKLPVNQLIAAICSVVMILIMLPLFVTSFVFVRRRMNGKTWKRLQRWAYLFYALLYTHIMLLTIPYALQRRAGYRLTVWVYSMIFLSYAVCRLMKARAIKHKTGSTLAKRQWGGIAFGAAASLCIWGTVQYGGAIKTLQEEPVAAGAYQPQTQEDTDAESIETGVYRDGIFEGRAPGNNGDIAVEVTIEDHEIVAIKITEFYDDQIYFDKDVDGVAMIDQMLEAQSADIDTISGATISSGALIDAVELALESAK